MSDDFRGRGGSPWGSPPGGGNNNGSGRGPTPPNIDEIIKEIQDKIKKFLPGGKSSGGKSIGLILLVLAFVWLASGLYRVLPDEQGVVLRFGKFVKTTQPGLNYHVPFPVENVLTPKVTKVNRIDIGFRSERDSGFSTGGGVADVPQESLMLTGDENIVNIDFSVFWVIKDAGNFLFKIQDPEGTVKAAAETAMREVIAKSDIQPILTEGRSKIEVETQEIIQNILGNLFVVLLVITILGMYFSTELTYIFAPGFADDNAKLSLTSEMLFVTFPYLLFISLFSYYLDKM